MGMFRRSQLTTSSPKGTQVHPIKIIDYIEDIGKKEFDLFD